MRYVTAVLLLLVLVGCGGGEEPGENAEADSPTVAPTETATAEPALTLVEACPEVEAALPKGFVPGARKMTLFVANLEYLRGRADLETQNALDLLIPGATKYRNWQVEGRTGFGFIDVEAALDEGVSAFAKRCRSAGSSALR